MQGSAERRPNLPVLHLQMVRDGYIQHLPPEEAEEIASRALRPITQALPIVFRDRPELSHGVMRNIAMDPEASGSGSPLRIAALGAGIFASKMLEDEMITAFKVGRREEVKAFLEARLGAEICADMIVSAKEGGLDQDEVAGLIQTFGKVTGVRPKPERQEEAVAIVQQKVAARQAVLRTEGVSALVAHVRRNFEEETNEQLKPLNREFYVAGAGLVADIFSCFYAEFTSGRYLQEPQAE